MANNPQTVRNNAKLENITEIGINSSISIWVSNRERNTGLSLSNFSWQSEKISAKESCLYGIISIRITPFLDVGL